MTGARAGSLCVVGFVYLEVYLPSSVGSPPPGREVFLPSLPVGLGGALNIASVAAALGVSTSLMRPSCGAVEPAARAAARSLGIEDRSWPSCATAVSLVFSSPTDRSFLSAADFEAWSACPTLPTEGWIHVAGLEEASRIRERLQEAREAGARICVGGSWAPQILKRLAEVSDRWWDLIVLNEDEASAVHEDKEKVFALLSRVAGDVVVTNGPGRVEALMKGERFRIPVPDHQGLGDYTGVGDAFCSALICGLIRGRDPEAALRLGVAAASRVVGIRGGVVTDPALLADLVPR